MIGCGGDGATTAFVLYDYTSPVSKGAIYTKAILFVSNEKPPRQLHFP
jgi:hypothetical protein